MHLSMAMTTDMVTIRFLFKIAMMKCAYYFHLRREVKRKTFFNILSLALKKVMLYINLTNRLVGTVKRGEVPLSRKNLKLRSKKS